MGTLQTWRKTLGALKDHTTVGLAQINSDFKDVDVAIVKATNHVEHPPKERYVRKIMAATSAVRPRADVAYCIHALSRRLAKTHNWTVALKTLIVLHRTLREGDPTFREELLNFQQRGRIIQMSNFKDDSSPIAWDCSAWVRTYALFLEERLECFRILKYDIEAERLPRLAPGQDKGYSKTRELSSEELLDQLPALQQLLYRLMGCRPEGAAVNNYVIQYALALVLKESFKIYCAINDGIINLVDKFFEMPRHEAIKSLDVYKRAGQQASNLSDFYEVCKGLELARNFQFPALKEPPQSFLITMEDYIQEAPRMVSVPSETLEYPERLMLTYKPHEEEDNLPYEEAMIPEDEQKPPPSDDVAVAFADSHVAPPQPSSSDSTDLLGLNMTTADAFAIEESNALALAIVPNGESNATQAKSFDPTGWELSLVETPSNNISSVQERQWAGGLDSLILNSLYDDAAYRASSQQQPSYGAPSQQQSLYGAPNPFGAPDPFAMSNNVPSPPAVQMAAMSQFQTNPFTSFQPTYPQQSQPPQQQQQEQLMLMGPTNQQNPFMDSGFGPFPANPDNHQHANNPFGSPSLL